jgi:hypothetical protein
VDETEPAEEAFVFTSASRCSLLTYDSYHSSFSLQHSSGYTGTPPPPFDYPPSYHQHPYGGSPPPPSHPDQYGRYFYPAGDTTFPSRAPGPLSSPVGLTRPYDHPGSSTTRPSPAGYHPRGLDAASHGGGGAGFNSDEESDGGPTF